MTPASTAAAAPRRVATTGGLVLVDEAANRLFAYNDTAGEIWDFVVERGSEEGAADEIAGRYGIGRDVALRDIRGIVADWRAKGLVGRRLDEARAAAPDHAGSDWRSPPAAGWARTLTCRIRHRLIAFRVESARYRPIVDILYSHLAASDATPPAAVVDLREAEGGETALVIDGVERLRTKEGGELIGGLNQTVLELVNPGTAWMAMIHGGAIARNARGVALPAACGSGKTTLVAHLMPAGYDYLADDLIALAAPDGKIVPLPLPLSVKESSWDFLAATYPDLVHAPEYTTARGRSRQLVPSRSAWERDPVPLVAFVFPKYVAGSATIFTRITPLDALQRLLGDRIWLGFPLRAEQVEAFIAWLDGVPAYDLVHGDAADAARRFAEIM